MGLFYLINTNYLRFFFFFFISGIGYFEGIFQFEESFNRCFPWEWDEEVIFLADDSSGVFILFLYFFFWQGQAFQRLYSVSFFLDVGLNFIIFHMT